MAAHQQLTMDWWDLAMPNLDGYISPIVLEEISKGDPQAAAKRLAIVDRFEVLEIVPEIQLLADLYFNAIDLPEKARADAYHLAISVQHGMDYLVTWNCVHIAGARVKRILEVINQRRNLQSPVFCTPEELMEI